MITKIDINRIHPNPDNPRSDLGELDDLAASLKQVGMLQPVMVMPIAGKTNRFQLLIGHRRLAAAELAGWYAVPAIVVKAKTQTEALAIALTENGQRRNLDPIEEAQTLQRIMSVQGLSQKAMGERIGRSGMHVSHRLALLELSPQQQEQVRRGQMTLDQARAKVKAKRNNRPTGNSIWHFSSGHPLAAEVRDLCRLSGHSRAKSMLVGQQGCGRCWEAVIRDDERARLLNSEVAS